MNRHIAIKSADIWRYKNITFESGGVHRVHESISTAKRYVRGHACVSLYLHEVKHYGFWIWI